MSTEKRGLVRPKGLSVGSAKPVSKQERLPKAQRHFKIAEILAKNKISSQTSLVDMLTGQGIYTTQATLSRDLEEMGAVKVRVGGGDLVYAIPELPGHLNVPTDLLRRVFVDWVSDIRHNDSLVIIKTAPGSAHVVGSGVDRSDLESVIGTIAGDDTLLVVCAKGHKPADVAKELLKLTKR